MKKAIVIGASSGIGMEVARLLLKEGWKVGAAARRLDLLNTIGDVETQQIDVTKPEATQQLQYLIERVGGLNICFTDIRPGFVDTALLDGNFKYPMKLKPEAVAREIVHAINRKQHVRIIDWKYRILTAIWCRIPKAIWRHLKL